MKDSAVVSALCWKVNDSRACDELDLPELTSIQFGNESIFFEGGWNDSSEFILRSCPLGWL